MTNETFGVNVHQDIQGCVEEFNKLHEPEIEQEPDPDEPNREALDYVAKGRLDPATGIEIPCTHKARSCALKQFGSISEAYKQGYDKIKWDK